MPTINKPAGFYVWCFLSNTTPGKVLLSDARLIFSKTIRHKIETFLFMRGVKYFDVKNEQEYYVP